MATNRTISKYISEHDIVDCKKKLPCCIRRWNVSRDGVERVEFTNLSVEKCEVFLTFRYRVEPYPFPLRYFFILEKLFGQSSNGIFILDIVVQT